MYYPHEAIYGTCACMNVCTFCLVYAQMYVCVCCACLCSLASIPPLSHSSPLSPPHRDLSFNQIQELPNSFGSLRVGGNL